MFISITDSDGDEIVINTDYIIHMNRRIGSMNLYLVKMSTVGCITISEDEYKRILPGLLNRGIQESDKAERDDCQQLPSYDEIVEEAEWWKTAEENPDRVKREEED